MYAQVPKAGYGTVGAIWNAGYDIGMAAGAIGAGLLIISTGFLFAFLITAATMVPTPVMAHRERARKADHSIGAKADLGAEPAPA
jgi:predicted MFS family arabinose efflux permease